MKVTDTSQKASALYQKANSELASFNFENAYSHLSQAYSLALSVDDSQLLTKICLSSMICKISYKQRIQHDLNDNLAFYSLNAPDFLNEAKLYAERSQKAEVLGAVCKIYEARLNLFYENSLDKKKNPVSQNSLVAFNTDELDGYSQILKKEPYYLAFLKKTLGDIYAYKNEFLAAKNEYLSAADIHIKNRDLNEIGHDFYNAARMASNLKQKEEALSLIDKALKYDKDAENTVAIASDYVGFALILIKNEPTAQEKVSAKNAALWARKIYLSKGFLTEADFCLKLAQGI